MSGEEIITIIEPSKKIYDLFDHIKEKISNNLPESEIELIGSFAVPMKGKKEIDILIQTENVESAQNFLTKIGFSKGPIIKREGFCINRDHEIIIELHIVPFNHKKIKTYRKLITKFRKNPEIKKRFENLKMAFEGKPAKEYKEAKNEFIKENNLLESG